jgi:hypothetical protein
MNRGPERFLTLVIIQIQIRVNVVAWVIVVTMDPDIHCRIFVVRSAREFTGDVIALALRVLVLASGTRTRARGDNK